MFICDVIVFGMVMKDYAIFYGWTSVQSAQMQNVEILIFIEVL